MGSICHKEAKADKEPDVDPKDNITLPTTSPNKVNAGSRVYIWAQDPSVDLPIKIIHLPQVITSGSGNGDGVDDVRASIVNSKADQRPLSQLSQVAYVPQSYANSDPDLVPDHHGNSQNLLKDTLNKVAGIFHYKLGHGPQTDDCVIELLNMKIHKVEPTEGNDYLYNPKTHPAEFDAINTLAVSQFIINMFRRCLWENGEREPPSWRWGKKPIKLFPYAAQVKNAFYSAAKDRATPGRINYGYFNENGQPWYFCRSFDVIAHETGHALLDGIKPDMLDEGLLEGLALTEAFGDLTAVFGVLYQLDLCQVILRESRFNLHNKTFLSIIADGYGQRGIRSVDNNLKVSDVEAEAHALALVIAGAIYDIIADTFQLKQSGLQDVNSDAEILCDIGRHLLGLTIMALVKAPDIKIKFRDVTLGMISMERDEDIRDLMQKHFETRELLNLDLKAKARAGNLSLVHGCCETMKMRLESVSVRPTSTVLHSEPEDLPSQNRPISQTENVIPHRTVVSVDM